MPSAKLPSAMPISRGVPTKACCLMVMLLLLLQLVLVSVVLLVITTPSVGEKVVRESKMLFRLRKRKSIKLGTFSNFISYINFILSNIYHWFVQC